MTDDEAVNRLKNRMKQKGMRNVDLHRVTKLSQSYLCKLLKSRRSLVNAGGETHSKLEDALSVPHGYFFDDGVGVEEYLAKTILLDSIPLPLYIGMDSLWNDSLLNDRSDLMHIPTPRDTILKANALEEHCFWVEARGTLFAPRVFPGDQVLLTTDYDRNGALVLGVIPQENGQRRLVMKRFMGYGPSIRLIPELENDTEELVFTKDQVVALGIRIYRVIRISTAP